MQPNIIKSSMSNGLILGILFSINFLLSITKITPLVLISYGLMTFILVVTYRTAIRFRDKECLGEINFGKAFSFIILTYFFAALISSVVKYVYFQFIDPDIFTEITE